MNPSQGKGVETLRWCDGKERAQYCTVLAACKDGQVLPVGLTW